MSSLALASWLSQLAHPVVGRPRHWMGHALPECLAGAALLLRTITPLEALILPTVVRLAWLLAEVSHGSAHTLVRALVDGDASLIRLDNLLEHRRPGALMAALRPFALLPLFPHTRDGLARLPSGDPTSWKVRLKAAAPLMLHLTVSLAAATALLEQPEAGTPGAHGWAADGLVAMLLANLWLLLLSRSDWQMLACGKGRWLYCGNFGLLAATDHPQQGDLLSGQTIRMAQRMGRETELRGAQAGGGLVMAMDRRGQAAFVGEKIVNAKRGDLTPALESAFRQSRRRARRHGVRRHPAGLVACWHYRFGTSGPPAVRETHWQEWSPARRARIWSRQPNGQWHWQWQTVHHRITHNGDFETLEAFGTRVAVTGDLGSWLERVLEQPAPAVVDSARIAGMMDLLICQGDWWAAVRWGALRTLISYPASIPGSALERWASWFEKAFEVWSQEGGGRPGADGENQQLTPALVALLLPSLRSDPLLAHRSDGDLKAWIAACVGNFLQNDPARATRQFMDHARGSFGLVVISTTWPDRLVLCSLGQPLTVGVHPREGMALYASEPAAVDAVLLDQPGSWRCDLDDNAGEIAVLSHSSLQIYSLSLERSLSDQEQNARQVNYRGTDAAGRWPSAPRDRRADHDPVGADIASIPSLLAAIHDDWSNPGSANRRSAEALAQLLIAKAANLAEKEKLLRSAGLDESLSRSSHVDLLITGVENSLWLGEQFGRDLNSLMPRLTVRTLSANEVLKALQNDVESLDLARQTIVLVLSHTSRTFPSRQVMEACDLLVRRRVIREFFVMTGEPENLLGSPMLQGQRSPRAGRPETSSLHRLFTTGAGRRRSEAATATVVAMEQTLTQLLFSLSRQVLQAFPATQPLGMRLSRTTLARLETTENEALLQDSQIIVGTNQQGAPRPSTTSRSLATMGRQWSQHVLESPLAWLLHAAYITVSLELGLPLVETLARQLVGESLWDGAGTWSALLRAVALAGDVLFYIFGPWIWTVLLRWLQGRPLLARLGRRTLVVSETTWLHPLLTNYISKLFALSFGITSLDIQGADGGDHLLHTHAHRVVRGTLLFFGVPDGRSGGRQQAEANAFLLTARQADGIRNWNTGPELAAVGSDPALGLGPFRQAVVLPCATEHQGEGLSTLAQEDALVEQLRESRFGSVRRLLAAYVMFWAMARAVGMLPLLRFKWWRSQSRTRVMTTAAPVSAARLDLAEPREVLVLSLEQLANREQS